MIRNAVVHLLNDQPLLADLFRLPSPRDYAIVCTNVRGADGKRPAFIARSDGVFVFPLTQVRFLELPPVPDDAFDALDEEAAARFSRAAADGGSTEISESAPAAPRAADRAAVKPPEPVRLSDDAEFFDNALLRRIREM